MHKNHSLARRRTTQRRKSNEYESLQQIFFVHIGNSENAFSTLLVWFRVLEFFMLAARRVEKAFIGNAVYSPKKQTSVHQCRHSRRLTLRSHHHNFNVIRSLDFFLHSRSSG